MGSHIMLYRGSLKSCNYCCSYCPFSKHGMQEKELAKDRQQWVSFVQYYITYAKRLDLHALMLTPYGEALLHPWYWEGMARLSALMWVEAVGAQTNLGFPVGDSLRLFVENGGALKKLRLWATFHPEMTTVEEFVHSCGRFLSEGVLMSVGAVGVPENLALLRCLRERLPKGVYLWINKMDGLGRGYTAEERRAFLDIDPYFYRELLPHPADASQCQGRFFAEADGRLRMCNISPVLEIGWKELFCNGAKAGEGQRFQPCTRKRCSCYLAYGGMENAENQILFGPEPLFRIPGSGAAHALTKNGI